MKKNINIFIVTLLFTATGLAQTGTPAVFNVSGGCSKLVNNLYYFDWSLGEETFIETSPFGTSFITHGVLQPEFPNPNTDQQWGKFELKIYPNPATDWVILDFFSFNKGNVYMNFYDETGRLMYAGKFYYSGGPHTEKINIARFASGTYLLNVQLLQSLLDSPSNYKNSTYKIVKAKSIF